MRITFISPFAQLAGSERYLGLVLDGIQRERVADVILLQAGPFVDELRDYEPVVWPTGPGPLSILRAALRLRRRLRANRPELVHANGIKAALVAVLATLGSRLPVVWVKHDLSFDRSLARPVAWRCRLVIGVSEAAVRAFRDRSKVRIVPNALPPIHVERRPTNRPTVALVGRLYEMKGQHELLEAAPELVARVPDVRIVLAGPEDPSVPEYAAELRARTAELGLGAVVDFVGPVESVPHFLAGCDAVAIPSVPAERGNTESFSLVALEAMAAGTPIAAYAEGGLPETLGACALLVPTHDRAGLAEALARILEDEELRTRLVECGRARVASEFSLERMRADLEARYREALG